MRIALISDIHGNLPALDAVLEDLQGDAVDQIVCLGDVGAMGPFPCETLERVHEIGCPVIMGNGDAAMLEPPPEPSDDETQRGFQDMDRWCAEQLDETHLEFVRSFADRLQLDLDDQHSLLCFHGSPCSYYDVISATTPDSEIAPMLVGFQATVMAGGHWHFQLLRRYQNMILFNPGSIGLPYEFDEAGEPYIPSRAEYGLVTVSDGDLRMEHRRVRYDSERTVRAMQEQGFPHAVWWARNWR